MFSVRQFSACSWRTDYLRGVSHLACRILFTSLLLPQLGSWVALLCFGEGVKEIAHVLACMPIFLIVD